MTTGRPRATLAGATGKLSTILRNLKTTGTLTWLLHLTTPQVVTSQFRRHHGGNEREIEELSPGSGIDLFCFSPGHRWPPPS